MSIDRRSFLKGLGAGAMFMATGCLKTGPSGKPAAAGQPASRRMDTERLTIGGDTYGVQLALQEDFETLERWHAPEQYGLWTAQGGGLRGEWLDRSPSLFLRQSVEGDYLWTIDATRLEPDGEFLQRFAASRHGRGADPAVTYNFNFWLRADTPDAGDFFQAYPAKLGTGWNGMGDDYWRSLYCTVVRKADDDWVRLRRSPGYQMVREARGIVPLLPYGQAHRYAFALHRGHVRMYFDEQRVYDYDDSDLYPCGHVGLCVWMCVMRFERMRLYRMI